MQLRSIKIENADLALPVNSYNIDNNIFGLMRLKNDFVQRALLSIILAPILLYLVYLGGWWLYGLLMVACLEMMREWQKISRKPFLEAQFAAASGHDLQDSDNHDEVGGELLRPTKYSDIKLGGGIMAYFSVILPQLAMINQQIILALFLLAIGMAAILMIGWRASKSQKWLAIGVIYITFPALMIIHIAQQYGTSYLYVLIGMVWVIDCSAYLFGKLIGGKKMAPKLSPGKTWAGFWSAVLSLSLSLGLVFYFLSQEPQDFSIASLIFLLLSALIITVIAQSGDLFESYVKRKFGVKDSSRILLSHGGFMDRLDSLWALSLVMGLAIISEQLIERLM